MYNTEEKQEVIRKRAGASFLRLTPLTVKVLIMVGLVVTLIWPLLDYYQSKRLKEVFLSQLSKKLKYQAHHGRIELDSYIKRYHQAVKVFTVLESFIAYLNSMEGREEEEPPLIYDQPPPWYPRRTIARSFVLPRFAILINDRGKVLEIYRTRQEEIPDSLINPDAIILQLSIDQNYMTTLNGQPFLLTSKRTAATKSGESYVLMLASPLDQEFLVRALGHHDQEQRVALITGENPYILASNNPDKLTKGALLNDLEDKFLIEGKSFFDYGSSDLMLQFVSFIPLDEVRIMTEEMLSSNRQRSAVVVFVIVVALLQIMGWITHRIAILTKLVMGFSEEILGKKMEGNLRGDKLFILEQRFSELIEDVISSRKGMEKKAIELQKAKDELEDKVTERTKELSSTNVQLLTEVRERKKAERKIEFNYNVQRVISSVLRVSLEQTTLKKLLERTIDFIKSVPEISFKSNCAIFITDEGGDRDGENNRHLILKAESGFDSSLIEKCSIVPFGKCLCGKAALSGEIVFVDRVDHKHEPLSDSAPDHGHYCVPIKSGDNVTGVIAIYLEKGHIRNPMEEDFLQSLADTLAGIIERKRIEAELNASNELFQTLIDNIPDSIYFKDMENRFVKVNRAKAVNSSTTIDDMTGKTDYDYLPDDQAEGAFKDDDLVKETGQPIIDKVERISHKEGIEKWVSVVKIPWYGKNREIIGTIGISRDISKLKATEDKLRDSEQKLKYLAHHDALTGLPNRLLFNDRIKQVLSYSRRNNKMFAVMFLDLDHFKDINDTLGHDAGDDLLKEVAERLKGCVRGSDTVARQGGDEFIVLLIDINGIDVVKLVAGKIVELLSKSFTLKGEERFISTSIGISVFPDNGDDVEELVKKADIALYDAKSKGRKNYKFYKAGDR